MDKLDEKFQESLLKGMVCDSQFYGLVSGIVKSKYFESPTDAYIAKTLHKIFLKYHEYPTPDMMKVEIRRGDPGNRAIQRVKHLRSLPSLKSVEKKYLSSELARFSKRQNWISTLDKSIDLLNSGDVEGFEKVAKDCLNFGNMVDDSEEWGYLTDISKRFLFSRKDRTVRTLIPELDDHLRGGGIGPGEIGVVLAPTQIGKTFYLLFMNRSAVLQRAPSVHINLEMDEESLVARLDASFTGIPTMELEQHRQTRFRKIQSIASKYQNEMLWVKAWPAGTKSVNDIDSYLEMLLQKHSFSPRLLTLDYADWLRTDWSFREEDSSQRSLNIGNIYILLKSLAQRRGLAIWTASQVPKSSFSKPLITLADVGESSKKAFIADVVVALSQTPREQVDEEMRIFLAKNRNYLSRLKFNIRTNFGKGCFYRR